MTTLAHWSPLRDVLRMQEEIHRLFDHAVPARDGEALAAGWKPAVDVYEDAEGVTLTAEVPGVSPDAIDLRVENGVLTLKGERRLDREDRKENYRRIERFFGSFTRSFSLPPTVDAERIRADFRNGVLTVFVPRREDTKPRQIKVQVQA